MSLQSINSCINDEAIFLDKFVFFIHDEAFLVCLMLRFVVASLSFGYRLAQKKDKLGNKRMHGKR